MNRAEHMAWCKRRALEYVEQGDVANALASMTSDVSKHPATNTATVSLLLALEGTRLAIADDVEGMRRFIEGFAE